MSKYGSLDPILTEITRLAYQIWGLQLKIGGQNAVLGFMENAEAISRFSYMEGIYKTNNARV